MRRIEVTCLGGKDSVANASGGWMALEGDRVVAIPCPSDSFDSPCAFTTLGLSIMNRTDWHRRVKSSKGGVETTCRPGYDGRLCSKCKQGYFRAGRSCWPCGSRGLSWISPTLSVLVLTALGVKTAAGGQSARSGLIRTLTLHAQVMALLPELSLQLPEAVGFLIGTGGGAGGFRLNGLECVDPVGWDAFWGPWVQAALLPVQVLVGALWVATLAGFTRSGMAFSFRARVLTSVFYLWLVLSFPALQRLFAVLNCTKYGSSTSRFGYLSAYLWIKCGGATYNHVWLLSLALGMLYTMSTAGVIGWRLRPGAAGASAVSTFLRSPYKPGSYFWEGVQIARRISLVLISSLSPLGRARQPVLVSIVLVISLMLQLWRNPFRSRLDNVFESASLALLVTTYMAGLVVSNPRFDISRELTIWAFLVLNVLFLLAISFLIIKRSTEARLRRMGRDSLGESQPEDWVDLGGDPATRSRLREKLLNEAEK